MCTINPNESQEARELTDISITHSSPDNKEIGNTGKGSLLEENLAGSENYECAEFHSEQEEHSNDMTNPGMFDLDNMDETLKKRLILNGASQPKSADMPQKAFAKSKRGSHLVPCKNWQRNCASKLDFLFCQQRYCVLPLLHVFW